MQLIDCSSETIRGYEAELLCFNNFVTVKHNGPVYVEDIVLQGRETMSEELGEYLPFLRFLYEKRDDLYQLLSGVQEEGKIPRYAVPGLV
jgi:hypothetical protein